MSDLAPLYRKAADLLRAADGLVIAAGAGMGVDSGLPDFRGNEGFWRAYPALARDAIGFEDIANPQAFARRPALAWGFYGHRLDLYRHTRPHEGFAILRAIGDRLPGGARVFTSNVDGQFAAAGFPEERIVEIHGSIHRLQCQGACPVEPWPAEGFEPIVDEAQCLLLSPYPRCPRCNGIARPNLLMFDDWQWFGDRTAERLAALESWLAGLANPVVVEIGAGVHIATVRRFAARSRGPLIRINPADPGLPAGRDGVALRAGALAALRGIADALAG